MYSSKKIKYLNWPPLPKDLKNIYNSTLLKTKIYLFLRWRLCPFFKIKEHIPQSGNVLDLGCGLGILSNILALESEQRIIHGIDISETRICEANKTIKNRKNIRFSKDNFYKINFAEYNSIIMSDFLHHLSNEEQMSLLKIIYKNINPGTMLFILDVNKDNSIKFHFANIIDFILNGKQSNFKPISDWEITLKYLNFKITKVIDLSKNLPLSDFLIIARKR